MYSKIIKDNWYNYITNMQCKSQKEFDEIIKLGTEELKSNNRETTIAVLPYMKEIYNNRNIYFDKNKFDGTDKNIVVYGHNRKDESMFGTLKNILNENWYNNEKNLQIKFVTEEGEYTFQVFSIYRIEKEDYYITTNFKNDFEKFFNTIMKRSIKNFNIELNENDQILTLSTCDDNNNVKIKKDKILAFHVYQSFAERLLQN